MNTITVSQNDYGYYITDTLENSDGTPFDLTDYAVAFHIWNTAQPGKLLVNGTATVISNTAGTVQYNVQRTDFKILGQYKQEWEATTGSAKQSFPTAGNIIIVQESP
jgi:uncharacterized protein YceK